MKRCLILIALASISVGGCKMAAWQSPLALSKAFSEAMPETPTLLPKWSAEKEPIDSGFEQPVRMAVIWTDGVYSAPGKRSTRGLGGRMYFYNADNKSIPVEGQLTCYVYRDGEGVEGNDRPDRKYVFPANQFEQHYSETELGHSYSVWLPWADEENQQLSLAVLPVFRSSEGAVVMGQHALHVLPGEKPRPGPTKPGAYDGARVPASSTTNYAGESSFAKQSGGGKDYSVQQVNYQDSSTQKSKQLRTSTFDVPESLRQRIQAASNARLREMQDQSPIRQASLERLNSGQNLSNAAAAKAANGSAENASQSNAAGQPTSGMQVEAGPAVGSSSELPPGFQPLKSPDQGSLQQQPSVSDGPWTPPRLSRQFSQQRTPLWEKMPNRHQY